ncbi:acyl-CoA dehydrogenase family protein [Nocardia sp. NPDC059239]|uniref:acyl-CoA dehydrogenase family protein n=1 Tax=Nocardia sp. NPDC059239 TaxID=3346785 RepID=UPI003676283C
MPTNSQHISQDTYGTDHPGTIFALSELQPLDDDLFARTAEDLASKLGSLGEPGAEAQHLTESWQHIADVGWGGLLVPEELGGGGFALSFAALAAQALGRHGVVTPFLETAVVAPVLLRQATGTLRDDLLAKVAAGDVIVPISSIDDQMRFRASAVVSAHRDDTGQVLLSGRVRVPFGAMASGFIVIVDVNEEPQLAFVERDAAPLSDAGTADDPDLAVLDLDGVALPPDRLMSLSASAIGGVSVALALLDAYLVGAMSRATELTTSFVEERHQFGKPLSSFQAVRHHCADMYTSVVQSRLLCRQAIGAVASGERDPLPFFAHAAIAEKVLSTADLAHQLHGGVGYYRPYYLERITRGAYRATRLLCSTELVRDYCVSHLAGTTNPFNSVLGKLSNPAHITVDW